MKILIDNGHGWNTPGKRSPDGSLLEWKYTREIAKRVASELNARGIETELIVPEDSDITLSTRCKRANKTALREKGSILVSIHVNAAGGDGQWHNATGWSVFVAPNRSKNSEKLARCLLSKAREAGVMGNRCVPRDGYWVKSLAMCRDTLCPAILTENLFMDNRSDAAFLLREEGKAKITRLHVEGILDYLNS